MNERGILERVRNVVREHLQIVSPLGLDTDLFRDLELDSLKQLTLVVELENEFRIRFDSADEETVRTVGDLVGLIARRLAEGDEEADG